MMYTHESFNCMMCANIETRVFFNKILNSKGHNIWALIHTGLSSFLTAKLVIDFRESTADVRLSLSLFLLSG